MKVSIFDVAKKSGLSVVTVSRVLNGAESVRENNRQKVLEAIKELDYRPNAAARSLASGKTGIIGIIVTTLQDSFFDAVVKELNEILAMHGYFLAISISTGIESDDSHYLIQEDRVDGLILLSPMEEDNYIVELKRRGIPYVLIDNQKPENDTYSITIDNFKGDTQLRVIYWSWDTLQSLISAVRKCSGVRGSGAVDFYRRFRNKGWPPLRSCLVISILGWDTIPANVG